MSVVLKDLKSGYNTSTINDNFATLKDYINNNLLNRSGLVVGQPNQMENDLDMNSKKILNLPAPTSPSDPVRLTDLPITLLSSQQIQDQVDASLAQTVADVDAKIDAIDTAVGAGKKRALINGDFLVWQEGDSFSIGPNQVVTTADMWKCWAVGGGAVDVSRITTALPTVAEAGRLIQNGIEIDVTTADNSLSGTNTYALRGLIEGYDFVPLAQQPLTLSFWHKHSKIGTYCVSIRNYGGSGVSDQSYNLEYTQTTADTWEKEEVQIAASPAAGTWDYTNGTGLFVDFPLAIAPAIQTATADTWESGNFLSTVNQVNALDTIGNKFRIAEVKLEAGIVATEFGTSSYIDTKKLCQRYFAPINSQAFVGSVTSSTEITAKASLPEEMRIAPFITLKDTNPSILYAATGKTGSSSTITLTRASERDVRISIDGFSGVTPGTGILFDELTTLVNADSRLSG